MWSYFGGGPSKGFDIRSLIVAGLEYGEKFKILMLYDYGLDMNVREINQCHLKILEN